MKFFLIILASLIQFYPLKRETILESNSIELIKEKDSLVIYGKIKDNIGDSFKYVNVHIQNSNQKIKVDKNGNYKVNVFEFLNKNKELIIQFSFLGYKTEKRRVTKDLFNKNNILEMNIKLMEDNTKIECPNG